MVVLVKLQDSNTQIVPNPFQVEVLSHHGPPAAIISNRDPRF